MSKAKRKNSSYKTEPKKPVINSRSDRIRYANQKLYDYPLSVTWFRIFKTVITVLQAVMSGYSAIVCVVSVFASFSDEVQKQANAAAIPGFLSPVENPKSPINPASSSEYRVTITLSGIMPFMPR